ncbi:MAG: D-alanyl-D-alanine carboxypeptidase [Clostridia bacterium]|nr:D-alanyl-D-alanine carboxypeptidase [Clostridia bacterium]
MRKICLILFFFVIFSRTEAYALEVSAEYACVIEEKTGEVVYEKNARIAYPMASTTKIMTALTAIEADALDDVVTVSANAANQEGSSMYLRSGDKILMRDLLYGLMLNSGNDAAVAIAEHVAGDVESFAKLMTEKAHEIGARNTQFKNPSGLDEAGHYTTAYDLALITRRSMQNPEFAEIVKTKNKKISLINTQADIYLSNHNKMLDIYSGADGVKTGYTKATGRCLVSTAVRDGMRFIAVTLNAPDDWNDHKKMLDYAFENYERRTVITAGSIIKTVKTENDEEVGVCAGKSFDVAVRKNKEPDCTIVLHISDRLKAPINKGEKIGVLDIVYKHEIIKTIDLVSSDDVMKNIRQADKVSFAEELKNIFKAWLIKQT